MSQVIVAFQVAHCFVLDVDRRAFLAAIKDRKAAGLPMVTPPSAEPAASAADALATPSDDAGEAWQWKHQLRKCTYVR